MWAYPAWMVLNYVVVSQRFQKTRRYPWCFCLGTIARKISLPGYDAGGQDYILKPFDVVSLHHKIENLQRIELEKRSLATQAGASEELASLVMANLDEYAVLIKFLRTLNECSSPIELVEAIQRVPLALRVLYRFACVISRRPTATKVRTGHWKSR